MLEKLDGGGMVTLRAGVATGAVFTGSSWLAAMAARAALRT